MNEAVKLAIEKGGYNLPREIPNAYLSKYGITDGLIMYDHEDYLSVSEIILDPLFWQALGKALGWGNEICASCKDKECGRGKTCGNPMDEWRYYAHQYFDLVLSNGSTEKFLKELLNKSKPLEH